MSTFGHPRAAVISPGGTITGTPAQGSISLDRTSVAFLAPSGSIILQTERVNVSNVGIGTLGNTKVGTVVYGSGSGWISSAVIHASQVLITVNPAGLAPAVYTATVPVEDVTADNTPQNITVTLTVSGIVAQPLLSFGATDITRVFTATEGGANPTPQVMTVSNDRGGTTLSGVVIQSISHAWFNPTYSAPDITIAPDITGIVAGQYVGSFEVDSNASNCPRTVGVIVDVSSAATAAIGVSPLQVSKTATAGGADPSDTNVTISNVGGGGSLGTLGTGTIVYNQGTGWADMSSIAGTTLTVRIQVGTLQAGTYTAQIPITATGASNSPLLFPVEFIVSGAPTPPVIDVSPTSLVFSATQGGANPASQDITVSNTGGGSFVNLRVQNPSASWLGVSIVGSTVTVAPITGSLAAGTHIGSFEIAADNATNTPLLYGNVTFNVSAVAPATMVLTPSALTFNATAGGANPSNQTVAVSNSGGGSLGTLTLGTPVYPGGGPSGWADTSSIASTTVTVRCVTGSLQPGTYTCTIPVNSTTATNTPQNVTVTFIVASGGTGGIIPAMLPPNGMSWNVALRRWEGVPTDPVTSLTCPNFNPATTFHAGAADHTAANASQLTTAINAAVDGEIIEITADITTSGVILRNRGTSGRVWIRSSGYASLPTYSTNYMTADTTNRVDPAIHSALLKKIRVTGINNQAISFAAGARGYVLTGLEVMPDNTLANSCATNWALIGINPTNNLAIGSSASLIRDVLIDRCYVHGNPVDPIAPDGNAARGIWLNSECVTIAHSVIKSISYYPGVSTENQGINGTNFKYLLCFNTHVDARTENIGPLGVSSGITNYLASDAAFIRCWVPKFDYRAPTDSLRHAVGGANGMWVKNWFEIKGGVRMLLYGCVMYNYWFADQSRALVLTPDTATWHEVRHITFMCCKFDLIDGGVVNWNTRGSGAFNNLGMSHVEMLHCDFSNVVNSSTFSQFQVAGANTTVHNNFANFKVHHNAFDHRNAWMQDFSSLVSMPNFYYCDNVWKRTVTFGAIFASDGSNANALNAHCGANNWTVRKNIGIQGGAPITGLTAAPHLNALTTSADLFTNAAGSDWTIRSGSAWKGYATDGTDPGPDWSLLNAATTGVRP